MGESGRKVQGCERRKGERMGRKEKYRTDIYDDVVEQNVSLLLKLPQYRKKTPAILFSNI